jgi:penicillin-binding protein 1A
MALPIVGKFFYKTYRDPKFSGLAASNFPQPGEELLAMLNEPAYKEVLDIDKREFNLADIFKGDRSADLGKRKETKSQEKGQLWQKIKNIFKKKENR